MADKLAAESREEMTERKLTEAQYQAAIEAYKKVSRTRIDDSSRAVIAAIAEHVQYSSEAAQEPRFTLAEIEAAGKEQGMSDVRIPDDLTALHKSASARKEFERQQIHGDIEGETESEFEEDFYMACGLYLGNKEPTDWEPSAVVVNLIERITRAEVELSAARETIARLSAAVSDEEWERHGFWKDSARPETDVTHREDVDALIAARLTVQQDKGDGKDGK